MSFLKIKSELTFHQARFRDDPELAAVPPLGGPDAEAGQGLAGLDAHVLARAYWLIIEKPNAQE